MKLSRQILVSFSSNKTWLQSSLTASVLALLSFSVWQRIFTQPNFP